MKLGCFRFKTISCKYGKVLSNRHDTTRDKRSSFGLAAAWLCELRAQWLANLKSWDGWSSTFRVLGQFCAHARHGNFKLGCLCMGNNIFHPVLQFLYYKDVTVRYLLWREKCASEETNPSFFSMAETFLSLKKEARSFADWLRRCQCNNRHFRMSMSRKYKFCWHKFILLYLLQVTCQRTPQEKNSSTIFAHRSYHVITHYTPIVNVILKCFSFHVLITCLARQESYLVLAVIYTLRPRLEQRTNKQ